MAVEWILAAVSPLRRPRHAARRRRRVRLHPAGRGRLAELREAHTSLVALVFWVGFRRRFVSYERQPRLEGRSGWTFGRKLRYAIDSVFSFTDLPIRALMLLGVDRHAVAIDRRA